MTEITVRDAVPDDALAVAEVHVASWQTAYRHALPAKTLDAMSADDRLAGWQWRLALPPERAAHVLVAELDGAIVGLAGTQLHEGDEPDVGELLQLYLHPDAFGTGVAQALHAEVLVRFRADGCHAALLDVEVDNHRARRFYERHGWQPITGSEKDVEAWGVSIRCLDHRLDL